MMLTMGEAINQLIAKNDLDFDTTETLFRAVIRDEETAMDQGAFLAALTAKGATSEEIAAVWKVIANEDTNKAEIRTDLPLAENSGTGMDAFKTFNISTAAAVVAAAGGVAMARHGSRGITSKCGTVDVAEALGVAVDVGVDVVAGSVEKCGIGLFNGMSPAVHPAGLGRILSQIHFGTVLNIAASLANPAAPRFGVRGVNDPAIVTETAKIMKAIGYERVLVLHGFIGDDEPGIDEGTTLGKTIFTEIDAKGRLTEGAFYPEDFGLKRGVKEDLAAYGDAGREARRLQAILAGGGSGPCADIVALNAALILYTAGIVPTIDKGIDVAKEKLAGGAAATKLREWVAAQSA